MKRIPNRLLYGTIALIMFNCSPRNAATESIEVSHLVTVDKREYYPKSDPFLTKNEADSLLTLANNGSRFIDKNDSLRMYLLSLKPESNQKFDSITLFVQLHVTTNVSNLTVKVNGFKFLRTGVFKEDSIRILPDSLALTFDVKPSENKFGGIIIVNGNEKSFEEKELFSDSRIIKKFSLKEFEIDSTTYQKKAPVQVPTQIDSLAT